MFAVRKSIFLSSQRQKRFLQRVQLVILVTDNHCYRRHDAVRDALHCRHRETRITDCKRHSVQLSVVGIKVLGGRGKAAGADKLKAAQYGSIVPLDRKSRWETSS